MRLSVFPEKQFFSGNPVVIPVGSSPPYMDSVERAERNVAVDNICRIAWALGVGASELFKA
jgi:hypothetical protein